MAGAKQHTPAQARQEVGAEATSHACWHSAGARGITQAARALHGSLPKNQKKKKKKERKGFVPCKAAENSSGRGSSGANGDLLGALGRVRAGARKQQEGREEVSHPGHGSP